jgi:hypothetical protein
MKRRLVKPCQIGLRLPFNPEGGVTGTTIRGVAALSTVKLQY